MQLYNISCRFWQLFRDGPFDIRGGGWDFFEKNSLFLDKSEKNVFNEVKNKKLILHSVNFFKALFLGSYKGLQITQNLTYIKHVDQLFTSSVLNVNYEFKRSIGIFVRTNCCITCSIGS